MLGTITDLNRIVLRRVKKLLVPHFKRQGSNYKTICHSILKNCYYDNFFHVSSGNFKNFFVRDFSIIAKHLINIGYKKEVFSTINFAFDSFMNSGHVATTITKTIFGYQAYDLPDYGFDSPALFVKIIFDSDYKLNDRQKRFLYQELEHMRKKYLDEQDLPKLDLTFSSMRDLQKRKRACYDVAMLAYLQQTLSELGLNFEFKTNYKGYLMNEYWNGEFFYDDLTKQNYFSTDANIIPFWLGIFNSKEMFEKVHKIIKRLNLAEPLPIKYNANEQIPSVKFRECEIFNKNYESGAIWIHLGLIYLDLLKEFDKNNELKIHLTKMKELVEKYGTLVEVLYDDLTPFKSLFYFCDEGMSWCASFFDLYEQITQM